MRKNNSIPLIFGVTGHRDLRNEDIENLEKSVYLLLKEYKDAYSNTDIIVISALAEGADMLVARIAKKLGLTLHVMLPYEEKRYLESFSDSENIKEFDRLKDYALKIKTLDCKTEIEECYENLGKYIADNANILLALWDNVENNKRGGTSSVIEYFQEGFENNRFDALDGNALYSIVTPRISNPDVQTDFIVTKKYMSKLKKTDSKRDPEKEFKNVLKKIDTINKDNKRDKLTDGSLLKTYMGYFESVAGTNQKKFKNYSKAILLFTFIAIASLEVMHVLHLDHFIIGYGLGLFLAFGLYHYFMKKGKVQDDFVYSRGLAEAIRVQNVWNHADVKESLLKHYLVNQHYKFTWVRVVLKNLVYADKVPFDPYSETYSVDTWIDEQIEYFKDAVDKRHKKLHRLEKAEKYFYRLGLGALVVMFSIYILESLHIVVHGALWFNWHYLILASGLLLLLAALIGEKYIKIEGYEEEIYHFNLMFSHFKDAENDLKVIKKGSDKYKQIICDLGVKALDENTKWVILHESIRAEPSLD